MAARAKRRLVCRYCGDECPNASDRDTRSHWDHNHPSQCPHRQDRVPSLNGVYVGQRWQNTHTGDVLVAAEIRLGGDFTYTDREPTVTLQDADPDAPRAWPSVHPLWSLAEHWRPLDGLERMPFDGLPVPAAPSERFHGSLSVPSEWRCPGYRHPEEPERDEEPRAYWHAWHTVINSGIQWHRTNEAWQVDPDAAPSLLDALDVPATYRPPGAPAPEPVREETSGQLALI